MTYKKSNLYHINKTVCMCAVEITITHIIRYKIMWMNIKTSTIMFKQLIVFFQKYFKYINFHFSHSMFWVVLFSLYFFHTWCIYWRLEENWRFCHIKHTRQVHYSSSHVQTVCVSRKHLLWQMFLSYLAISR